MIRANDNGHGQKPGVDYSGAERFLERALAAGCTFLDLRAPVESGENENVCSWEIPGVTIDEVAECAQNDSVGRQGMVRYTIVARKDPGSTWGRFAIQINAGAGNFGTENATLAGIVVECIRDKRAVTQMALGYTENLFARFQQMLEFHGAVAAKSEEKHMHMIEILEELISHKDERALKHKEMELKSITTKRMIDTFTPLIPAAANRLLGHFTGTPAPLGSDAMRELLKSFSPEQLQAFASQMTPTQLVAFSELYQTVTDEENAKERDEARERVEHDGDRS